MGVFLIVFACLAVCARYGREHVVSNKISTAQPRLVILFVWIPCSSVVLSKSCSSKSPELRFRNEDPPGN